MNRWMAMRAFTFTCSGVQHRQVGSADYMGDGRSSRSFNDTNQSTDDGS